MVNTPVSILNSSKPLLPVLPVLKVANIQSCSVTDLHSPQLQIHLSCLRLTCAESGQHANVSSCSVTDLHSPQLRTLFSLSVSPVPKVANVQVSPVTLWNKVYLLHSSKPFSLCLRLTCSESGQHANVLSHSVTDLHSILHSSKPFSLCVWDSPVLKEANGQMSWVAQWQTSCTAQSQSLDCCSVLSCPPCCRWHSPLQGFLQCPPQSELLLPLNNKK